MSDICFVSNGLVIVSTDFYKYDISGMSEQDLNQIVKKCIYLIRTKNGNEVDTAREMLHLISDEKKFRISMNANLISIRDQETAKLNNRQTALWSKIAVGAVVLVGLLQAYVGLIKDN